MKQALGLCWICGGYRVRDFEENEPGKRQSQDTTSGKQTLGYLRDLLGKIPWEASFRDKAAKKSWQLFKESL